MGRSTPLSPIRREAHTTPQSTKAPGLQYLDMTKLASLVPVPVPTAPMQPILVTDRSVSLSAMDPNLTTPYVQNLTLDLTRNVGRNLTVDVKYIGTLSRKLYGSINLNSPNFLFNGLKEAFDAARSGGESPLLDQMFNGINLVGGTGTGAVGTTVNGVLQTGAGQLRAASASSLRNNLANGNYVALANSLYTLNYNTTLAGNTSLPVIPTGVQGAVLRQNGFAENFIAASPQFSSRDFADESRQHQLQLASISVDVTADCGRQSSGDLHVQQAPGECRRVYPSI